MSRLVDFNDCIDPKDLFVFSEPLQTDNRKSYHYFMLQNTLDLRCLDRNAVESSDIISKVDYGKEKTYYFNLAIRRDSLIMKNYSSSLEHFQ